MNTLTRILTLSLMAGTILCSCTKPSAPETKATSFSRLDSLTERYLTLQENMLPAWNTILRDENEKFKAMHAILHELMQSGTEDNVELVALEHRLNELSTMRLSQQSLDNPTALEEYDFAVNSLVSEVITLGETHSTFPTNGKLHNWVEDIKETDQHVPRERHDYDSIARIFNAFLHRNQSVISEIVHDTAVVPRPLFDGGEE